ncbi:MAG: sigma-70 family RNA polymerase sigma factor [Verrucomicrobiota bacterium]
MLDAETGSDGSGRGVLLRVAMGDGTAMEECIHRFSGLVWSIARRHCGAGPDTEDVVQEIFTELWKTAARFDERKGREETFVGFIARRRSIDWVRRQARKPQLAEMREGEDVPVQTGRRLDGERLRNLVGKLSSERRELFRLHFDIGLTHPEIARETGLPLGTVKTQIRRGLIEMRSLIQREEELR